MKQHSITKLLTIFFFVMMVSCQKDTEILPEATKSGKGVFACMYDGKIFNAESIYAFADYYNNRLSNYLPVISIVAYNSTTSAPETIYLTLNEINSPGVYPIGGSNANISVMLNKDNNYHSYSYAGSIELTTIDTINHVVSGTFSGDLFLYTKSAQQGATEISIKDTISIRSGRFDLPLTIHQYP